MDLSPQRTFGNSQLAREVRIESAFPFFFDERVAERRRAAVVDGERDDRVAGALKSLPGFELQDLDGKGGALESEGLGALENSTCAARSPQSQRLGSTLQGHGPHQTDHAEQVVGVHVGEEDVLEGERHAVAHHLPLRAFAAVEHERFAFAVYSERRHVAFDRWSRCGSSKKANTQRHAREYSAQLDSFLQRSRGCVTSTLGLPFAQSGECNGRRAP